MTVKKFTDEEIKKALDILDKEIPKKVKVDDDEWFCCPNCYGTFGLINHLGQRNIYCGDCGQKLDWRDHPRKEQK